MTCKKLRILIVEDDDKPYEIEKAAAESACDKNSVKHELVRFEKLSELIDIKNDIGYRFDLMILDLRLDPTSSNSEGETLSELTGIIKSQFIPVVIYSAYTDDIDGESCIAQIRHLIKIVGKAESRGTPKLEEEITGLLKLKIPLIKLKESIERQFVETSSETVNEMLEGGGSAVDDVIQSMIISRLTNFMINKMNYIIGYNGDMPAEAKVIYPPLKAEGNVPVSMGDILEDEGENLWLVASPSCDMALDKETCMPKIKNALLLRCFRSCDEKEFYTEGLSVKFEPGNERTMPLKVPTNVSRGGMLMIHAKLYETRPFNKIKDWKKVITVASPYAEDIKANFMRDLIRLGTPDVNTKDKDLINKFRKTK